jgi:hypothetical protein
MSDFTHLKPLIHCGSCGIDQSLTEFRLLNDDPVTYVDFCKACEKQLGTISLYNKHLHSRWVTRRARDIIVSGKDPEARDIENKAVNYRSSRTSKTANPRG